MCLTLDNGMIYQNINQSESFLFYLFTKEFNLLYYPFMFMNVITDYFSRFKVIQGHTFGSRSCQDQTNSANVRPVIYHRYAQI